MPNAAIAPTQSEYITRAGLVGKRSWTERAITQFLGEPEKKAKNPHYRSGPEINLYALSRVQQVEASPEYQAWQRSSGKRRRGAEAAVETKRRNLAELIEALVIEVPKLEADQLTAKAVQNYNNHNYAIAERRMERGRDWDFEPATVAGCRNNPEFRDRIVVNWIRHRLSPYESQLEAAYGKVGVDEARGQIRAKAYAAIAKAYPELAAECARQQEQRENEEGVRAAWKRGSPR